LRSGATLELGKAGENGPEHELQHEAMLVIQMAVTHGLAMRKANTLKCVNTIPQQDSAGLALMRHRYIGLLF
jgi:hypothetical protein